MNKRTPRVLPRIYVYLSFLVIGLVGLMQEATTISSSRSLNSGQDQALDITLGAFHNHHASPLLSEMNRLVLQNSASKIAPQVVSDTADGKSTSVIILLADQADVSVAYDMRDQDARWTAAISQVQGD